MVISFNDKFHSKYHTSQLHKRVYFCKKKASKSIRLEALKYLLK